jgi:cytochrome c-type biogenesis protein CcmF
MEVLEFGHKLLVVAAVLTGAIFLCSLGGILLRERRLVLSARAGFYVLFVVLVGSATCLSYGFVTGEYNNEYIYNYSEKHLPTFFKVAGLWAGLDGSLLFWTLVLSAYCAVAAFQHRVSSRHPVGRRMEPYVYLVLTSVVGFFVAVSINENVFSVMDIEKRLGLAQTHQVGIDGSGNLLDGHGLNPQLVNYWFVIHPPTLYLGLIGFTIPFAFTIAALCVGEVGDYWVRITRRWTMVAWIFLTCGVFLGGFWAYRQLGWGGYWAWDPVENASFLPWLAGTAFLHSIMIQERRDMLRGWNVFLILLTFFLTIMATWMTRSGVVGSIHAFAGGGTIGLWFQVFMFVIAGVSFLLLFSRMRGLRGTHSIESLLSREAAFYLNNLVLLMIAAIVFFFSFWPKLSHDWFASPVTDHGWFKATTPFFAMLLFLTALGPGLGWVKTSLSSLRKNFTTSVLITAVLTTTVYVYFWANGMLGTWREVLLPRYWHLEQPRFWDLLISQHPTALYPTGLFIALAFFICATVFTELARVVTARARVRKESHATAFFTTVIRNNRRWGGYTVHVGLATVTLGIIASSMFRVEEETFLRPGQSTRVGDYRIELVEAKLRPNAIPGEPYWKDEVLFRVTEVASAGLPVAHGVADAEAAHGKETLVTELRPEGRFYPKQNNWIYEVSIHRRLLEDVYVYAKRVMSGPQLDDNFAMTLYVNPLMWLLYIGWFMMIAGALYAALPLAGSRVGLSE